MFLHCLHFFYLKTITISINFSIEIKNLKIYIMLYYSSHTNHLRILGFNLKRSRQELTTRITGKETDQCCNISVSACAQLTQNVTNSEAFV
jgi:hypothetical protein